MTTTLRRIALGAAIALAAVTALVGCSVFASPDPPTAVTESVDEALAAFRATGGVAEATADVSPIDSSWGGPILEKPEGWIARFSITAEPRIAELGALAGDIDDTLTIVRGTVTSAANLKLEADGAFAPTILEFSTGTKATAVGEMVAAAEALRAINGVGQTDVSTYPQPARVTVDGPARWVDVATALRALPGFGSGGLRAVSVSSPRTDDTDLEASVTLDAISPTLPLIAEVAELSRTAGVRSVGLDGVRGFDLVDEAGAWRPSLWFQTDIDGLPKTIAARLVALPDADSVIVGVPRTSFRISDYESSDEVTGFLGLPLGSATPDDGVPTASATSTPPPVDPALAAARLEDGRVFVTSLLDDAGDLAGIRGPTALETVACADDRGAQVRGSVVIPIFEIADRADAAFDSITQSWTGRGFEYADRGMGTDIYAASGLERLTIRGTAEGISISATADCNVA